MSKQLTNNEPKRVTQESAYIQIENVLQAVFELGDTLEEGAAEMQMTVEQFRAWGLECMQMITQLYLTNIPTAADEQYGYVGYSVLVEGCEEEFEAGERLRKAFEESK